MNTIFSRSPSVDSLEREIELQKLEVEELQKVFHPPLPAPPFNGDESPARVTLRQDIESLRKFWYEAISILSSPFPNAEVEADFIKRLRDDMLNAFKRNEWDMGKLEEEEEEELEDEKLDEDIVEHYPFRGVDAEAFKAFIEKSRMNCSMEPEPEERGRWWDCFGVFCVKR